MGKFGQRAETGRITKKATHDALGRVIAGGSIAGDYIPLEGHKGVFYIEPVGVNLTSEQKQALKKEYEEGLIANGLQDPEPTQLTESELQKLTHDQLDALAQERGVILEPSVTKAEKIAVLLS